MESSQHADRRQGLRVRAETAARLVRHGHPRACRLVDLSATGARLRTEHMDLPIVHPVELPTEHGEPLRVSARVVWRLGADCGVKFCGSDAERLDVAELVDAMLRRARA